MDVYAIVGEAATRKSMLIRCLTGCYNRNICDIGLEHEKRIKLYAVTNSLQASYITYDDFMKEASRLGCQAVLIGLWPHGHPMNPIKYPDALTYLNDFLIEGWKVKKVVVLANDELAVYSQFDVLAITDITKRPVNLTAKCVRTFFHWL